MKENKYAYILLGIISTTTGLAVSLTVLHAVLLGIYTGGYVIQIIQLLSLIKNSGMIPVLIVGGIIYVLGLILILMGCKSRHVEK